MIWAKLVLLLFHILNDKKYIKFRTFLNYNIQLRQSADCIYGGLELFSPIISPAFVFCLNNERIKNKHQKLIKIKPGKSYLHIVWSHLKNSGLSCMVLRYVVGRSWNQRITVINNLQKHLQNFAQTSCCANNKAKRMIWLKRWRPLQKYMFSLIERFRELSLKFQTKKYGRGRMHIKV